VALGRQPQFRDFTPSVSRYSVKVYRNRFGTLLKALNEFIAWVESGNSLDSNATEPAPPTKRTIPAPPTKRTIPAPPTKSTIPAQPIARRTRRDVTERQRFRILLRDGFRCLACGASPLRESGIQLHVDHIVPWSDGGETVDSNLQTKCSRCNLGKGSAFHA
jgi:5-methylcytosine-specific restriction endonuclease McrA